jgi:hypothetical protein
VRNFVESLSKSAGKPLNVRRGVLATLVSSLAMLAFAVPASAVVTEVSGTTVGLQPRNGTTLSTPGSSPATFANESGNAVVHGTSVYPVYWDPSHQFHHEWLTDVNTFFQRLGSSSGSLGTIFASLAQYRDRTNTGAIYQTAYKGSYSDTAKYPAAGCTDPAPLAVGAVTCLTDAQLRAQLQTYIASQGLPKGMNAVYYILTPPGVTVCVDAAASSCSDYKVTAGEESKEERKSVSYKNSFCSYHADINPDAAPEGDANTILYAAIPWSVGTQGLPGYQPKSSTYSRGFDCQDGGFSPINEKGERGEFPETAKVMSTAEEEAFEKDNAHDKAEIETQRALEGPHEQEPNQEGQGEFGDFSPGLSDLIDNQVAVEQANIVTDPLLNGWQDAGHDEATDECRNVFSSTAGPEGGEISGSVTAEEGTEAGTLANETLGIDGVALGADRYYINNSFSQAGSTCVGGVGLVPRFTAPDPVNHGEIVDFDGMESTVGLIEGFAFGPTGPPTRTYATFSWNFGDGTPEVKGFAPGAPLCEAPWLSPCAASIFHAYQYGGTYKVTLTVTDIGGYVSNVTHEVTVAGPPAPAPAPAPPGAGSAAAGHTFPAPIAAAAIISRSLKTALRKGLEVRYSVSEQVTGHFEVLVSRTLARQLHLGGAPATGLPAGSPAEVVIAKAVLVTTKAGRNTISIKFSRKIDAGLSHVHKASFMLRLVVHNASTIGPATTAVVSKSTLAH